MENSLADVGAFGVVAFKLAISMQRALRDAGIVDADKAITDMRDLLDRLVDHSQSPPAVAAQRVHGELAEEIRLWEAARAGGPAAT